MAALSKTAATYLFTEKNEAFNAALLVLRIPVISGPCEFHPLFLQPFVSNSAVLSMSQAHAAIVLRPINPPASRALSQLGILPGSAAPLRAPHHSWADWSLGAFSSEGTQRGCAALLCGAPSRA